MIPCINNRNLSFYLIGSTLFQRNQLLNSVYESIKYPPSDPLFLARLFTLISKSRKEETRSDELKKILTEEFDDLSKRAERSDLQSAFQIRNLIKARRLSEQLIDLGVIPYYLHQLDRVQGAAHFEADESIGLALIATRRASRTTSIPFGPFMLVGAWIGIAVGEPLSRGYLTLLAIG